MEQMRLDKQIVKRALEQAADMIGEPDFCDGYENGYENGYEDGQRAMLTQVGILAHDTVPAKWQRDMIQAVAADIEVLQRGRNLSLSTSELADTIRTALLIEGLVICKVDHASIDQIKEKLGIKRVSIVPDAKEPEEPDPSEDGYYFDEDDDDLQDSVDPEVIDALAKLAAKIGTEALATQLMRYMDNRF